MPRRCFHFWKQKIFLRIFFVSVNMGPYGRQNFKTLLLPQITFESFQTFSDSSQWSSQKYCFGFWNFECLIFREFVSFSLTWDPMGGKTSKCYSSLKSFLNPFKLFSEFSSQWYSQKYCFGLLKFLSFWFLTNFLISPLYPMGKPKTLFIWKTSDRGAKRSEIWARGVSIQCTQGTFDT